MRMAKVTRAKAALAATARQVKNRAAHYTSELPGASAKAQLALREAT